MTFINELRSKLRRRYYIIGYGSIEDIDVYANRKPHNVNWIKYNNYKIDWFADPYILSETETSIDFLVEEWIEKEHKGRLVKISYDKKKRNILDKRIILDLDTHLSFPSIIREEKNIYICRKCSFWQANDI